MTVWDQDLHVSAAKNFSKFVRLRSRAHYLDRDFGQVLRFPPEKSAGIVILEVGHRTTIEGIIGRLREFMALLESHSVVGELWIIEPGRVRIHLSDEGE